MPDTRGRGTGRCPARRPANGPGSRLNSAWRAVCAERRTHGSGRDGLALRFLLPAIEARWLDRPQDAHRLRSSASPGWSLVRIQVGPLSFFLLSPRRLLLLVSPPPGPAIGQAPPSPARPAPASASRFTRCFFISYFSGQHLATGRCVTRADSCHNLRMQAGGKPRSPVRPAGPQAGMGGTS